MFNIAFVHLNDIRYILKEIKVALLKEESSLLVNDEQMVNTLFTM